MVKQMIERIILEQSSQSVMSGTGYDSGNVGGGDYMQHQGGGSYGQQQGAGYSVGYGHQHQGGYGQQAGYGVQSHNDASAGAQKDYSAEWAAYYAAQAQGGGGAAAVTATATSPSPAPLGADAYYEQFHRYAYYYGDAAARQYYGAWSPPVGTPNPYGVNPNGVTAPPDAASGPAAAAAPASSSVEPTPAVTAAAAAAAANVRDTGRRGVSNLPAWMTNEN